MPLIVSVHVPKAAGSSLFLAYSDAFGESGVQRVDDDPLDPTALCNIDPDRYSRIAKRSGVPWGVRVVHGHFPAYRYESVADAIRVTVLRDPVERLLSHYFFWRHSSRRGHALLDHVCANDLTIVEFARLPLIGSMYRDVFFRDVSINRFDYVGDSMTLQTDLPRLSEVVGVDLALPVANTNPEPSYGEEVASIRDDYRVMQQIRDALKDDIAFYEDALGRTPTRTARTAPLAGGSQYADAGKVDRQVASGNHRSVVGGMWDAVGELALGFLVDHGVQPNDRFLDVGCGALRVGTQLVPYLDPGNYYGIDINRSLLDAGYDREIVPLGLDNRLPRNNLAVTTGFDVPFAGEFDTVLALSVFTHLPINDLRVFLEQMVSVTRDGSKIFVTYFPASKSGLISETVDHEPGGVRSCGDRNPFHLRDYDLESEVEGLPFDLDILGSWGHPRGQFIAQYTRR